MIALIQNDKAYGEVFNLGHTKDISIAELALMVKTLIDSDSEIVFVPYEEAYEVGFEDVSRRLPDLKKVQRVIGYQPSLDMQKMLERIIAFEKARLISVGKRG